MMCLQLNLFCKEAYAEVISTLKQELYRLKIAQNDLDTAHPWINELLTL